MKTVSKSTFVAFNFLIFKFSNILVFLQRNNGIVGVGTIMPQFKVVHNHKLTDKWMAVCIHALFAKNLECWNEYPTHSNEIEAGSFSTWPVNQIMEKDVEQGKLISDYAHNLFRLSSSRPRNLLQNEIFL